MKNSKLKQRFTGVPQNLRSIQGILAVEFAIAASVFFLVLFAVIETGRLFHTLGVLNETTRAAARLAAVCPMNSEGIFDRAVIVPIDGFDASHLSIRYLDGQMAETDIFENIRFVDASIQNYQIDLLILDLGLTINSPAFSTRIRSESLGVNSDGADCS